MLRYIQKFSKNKEQFTVSLYSDPSATDVGSDYWRLCYLW